MLVAQSELDLPRHQDERRLYTALVRFTLTRWDSTEAMRIVALLLWLERKIKAWSYFVSKAARRESSWIDGIAKEAELCLDYIDGAENLREIKGRLKYIDIRSFHGKRFVISEEIAEITKCVCGRLLSAITEQSTEMGATIMALRGRTLYFRFCRLQPVKEAEVADFFHRSYGPNCVDFILTRQASENEWGPLFALVVLRSASTVDRVLNGNAVAVFTINGRSAWASKYIPRCSGPQENPGADNLPPEFPYIIS